MLLTTRLLMFAAVMLPALTTSAQTPIPLYENGKVPNAITGNSDMDTLRGKSWLTGADTTILRAKTIMPTLTVYAPPPGKASGIAVIVCSGGSYRNVADRVEGIPAAEKLAAAGITAFLLHYRVPRPDLMVNKETGPVQDAQRAIQYVREHAQQYNIQADKVGIMGFSAGGHLVSTAGTHFNKTYIDNPRKINLRPDFMVLVYPVISFTDSLTHELSRQNLIGPAITSEKITEYSNELQVTANTPPTFIVHAVDDNIVKVGNSLYFVAALEQQQVPVRFFVYTKGGHGFGINNTTAGAQWIDPCISWIKEGDWQPKQQKDYSSSR
ncbi:Acetyl esterase/lipase [Chitinophaga jiangningensis]|uniref:Acetyl esterase/lipase n=1 Tax=Chitinophaga jiangningensis TaxID=1419482 RepID=A0A1M7BTV7_9BACT|nr:alpha/beta hydrolase [Chitinophaga jiangningensis]SHL58009.1 Acetyl esterase/lipase [Chitinophaga jiangningensis]